jgi:hypothetical protein
MWMAMTRSWPMALVMRAAQTVESTPPDKSINTLFVSPTWSRIALRHFPSRPAWNKEGRHVNRFIRGVRGSSDFLGENGQNEPKKSHKSDKSTLFRHIRHLSAEKLKVVKQPKQKKNSKKILKNKNKNLNKTSQINHIFQKISIFFLIFRKIGLEKFRKFWKNVLLFLKI